MAAITASLVGSTGLVGSEILKTLSSRPEIKTVHAYSRRELPGKESIRPLISDDSSSWPSKYPPDAQVFFSALGTTRGTAGGFANQRKIDYDLNLELAKAAKASGTTTYVLISSSGASSSSMAGYMKMKGELEEAVKALEFDHCVILRPGLLVGERAAQDSRPPEALLRRLATGMGLVSGNRLKDFWAQDADVVAKAAVRAGLDCVEGKEKQQYRVLSQADIVRLGRTDWKDT